MSINYSDIPLTFEANANTKIKISPKGSPYSVTLYYSKNNSNWTSYTLNNYIDLASGDTLAFSGTTQQFSKGNDNNAYQIIMSSSVNGSLKVYGNVNSLINNSALKQYCFARLLLSSNALGDASNLILPGDTFPAHCFEYMFFSDQYLTDGPLFPSGSYGTAALRNLFYNCTRLDSITAYFTSWNSSVTNGWWNTVASNGTFYKTSGLAEQYGTSYIPNGWSIVNINSQPQANFGTNICFKSTGSTTVTLNKIGNPQNTTIQYSTDGTNWSTVNGAINLGDGDQVAFSGNAKFSKNVQNRYSFSTTGNGTLAISGYLSSLVSSDTIEDDYEFNSLFSGCANITDVSGLVLPSNTTNWCYANMFIDCTQLKSTPVLPATSLNKWCYSSMFAGCTNLSSAPALPATGLAQYCYYCMFYGCNDLKNAPTLSASTLTDWCYNSMFYDCSKLSSMGVNFTEWSPSTATSNWVNGVAATGTFVKPSSLSAIFDNNHVPNDWSTATDEVDYTTMPLTFKSHGSTSIFLRTNGSDAPTKTFYYSKNGGDWTLYIDNEGSDYIGSTIYLSDGDTIAFSGTPNNLSIQTQNDSSQWMFNNDGNWDSSNYLQAYGNVMSLHNWQTLQNDQCYRSLFRDSTMISSCWNVIFPNDTNLNRNLGYSSVYRGSRVVVNPKMVRFSQSSTNYLDYTWNNASQTKYVGIDTPSWTGYGGGIPFASNGVLCKTPRTPIPYSINFNNVTIINWHEADDTYWVVTGSSGSTGTQTDQQVTLNDDGTITYL